jgi:hypothetical protein
MPSSTEISATAAPGPSLFGALAPDTLIDTCAAMGSIVINFGVVPRNVFTMPAVRQWPARVLPRPRSGDGYHNFN